ncbi:MAG: DMT family transporter, partial [Duncaniella sp.]|nr:DMT family transporter [Duncaniella sp.]
MMSQRVLYNLLALVAETFWGLTFVSTKVLIACGVTPTWIFIIRFALAYLCVLAICHKRFWSDSWRDELYMATMGLTGGSVYYIAENTALQWSYASNVSMIVCGATPLLTTLLCILFYGQRIGIKTVIGSALALAGVFMVIFNGSFSFGLSPTGDFLALLAALMWAVYCLQVKRMSGKYHNLFITRKVFFYGCVTGLLWSLLEHTPQLPAAGDVWTVVFNLLFLSIV